MKYKLLFFIFVLLLAQSAAAQDSSLVRIRVDVDNSLIYLDDSLVVYDSYGSELTPNAWFILSLPVGSYHFYIFNNIYKPVDSVISVVKDQVASIDIDYISKPPESRIYVMNPPNVQTVPFTLEGYPDSASIVYDSDTLDVFTPAQLFVTGGETRFEIVKDGYQPLLSSIDFEMAKNVKAVFSLKMNEPPPETAESMGLVYLEKQPMLNPVIAENLKNKYYSLGETFFVFPFCQGLLARLVVDDSQRKSANTLLLSGVVLSGGSFIIGKILYHKKIKYINAENERRTANNILADEYQAANDQLLHDKNQENYRNWSVENSDKGYINVTIDSMSHQ